MCSTQRYDSMTKMMNKSSYLLSSLSWGTPGAQGRARQTWAFLLVAAPWGGLLAWLSHVAWFLCDDAFISFRYARNLLEGHGLVFNPGEYVEGYSNFLWTLELALLWALFDLRPEYVAPWLSVACTVATIAAAALRTEHLGSGSAVLQRIGAGSHSSTTLPPPTSTFPPETILATV